MRFAIIVGIVLLVLFAAGETPRLIITLESPDGSVRELAARPVSCNLAPPIELETNFGTAGDCRALCAQDPGADGTYAMHVGVIPQLHCSGPRGEGLIIEGTGSIEGSVPVSFCTDASCTQRASYCDCIPPELEVEADHGWHAAPFNITVAATDNHVTARIETGRSNITCGNETCTANETVRIGTLCSRTGRGACVVSVSAYDAWSNEASATQRYNVDLQAPTATHMWHGVHGAWHRDEAQITIEARETTPDQSGISAIWVEQRTDTDCSPPGGNYTRYGQRGQSASVELSVRDTAGPFRFCYYATDRASPVNRGTVHVSEARRIDASGPVIVIGPAREWQARDTNVTFTCTDAGSGCEHVGTLLVNTTCPAPSDPRYTQQASIEATCDLGSVCRYHACAWARDGVGHTSSAERPISIDSSPPLIRIVVHDRSGSDAIVDLLVSDAGSGLDACTAFARGSEIGCEVSGDTSNVRLEFPCDGVCTYAVDVTDGAGNTERLEGTIDADGLI